MLEPHISISNSSLWQEKKMWELATREKKYIHKTEIDNILIGFLKSFNKIKKYRTHFYLQLF